MNLKNIALAGMLAVCTGSFAVAQDSSAVGSAFSAKDKTYLKTAAQSDMAEMKMAQLALQKSSNEDIKNYANQMMTDHQKTTDAAKPVAEKAGLSMPTDVNAMEKSACSKLEGLSGAQFDRTYVRINVKAHKKLLKEGKAEAASTQNSDMKTLTSMQEPIITEHTQKAEELVKKMGGKSGSPAGM